MSNDELMTLIRKGRQDKALDALYSSYPAFKHSFIKQGGKATDAEDIFQDSLVIFITKVSNKDFTLTCNFKSFLFSICRNLSHEYFRKKGKEVTFQQGIEEAYFDADIIRDFHDNEAKYVALDEILQSIGEKCLKLLSLYYFNGLDMKSIAQEMEFKTENSAKTQKYKCIEKARKRSVNILVDLNSAMS